MDANRKPNAKPREAEGHLKIYPNKDVLLLAIKDCQPLSGMMAKDGTIWAAYRPTKDQFREDEDKATALDWSRSALQFLNIVFNDSAGLWVSTICWFSPISVTPGTTMTLGGTQELKQHVDQYVLLLPRLGIGNEYENMFYVVGSNWTERISSGRFDLPQLSSDVFSDWETATVVAPQTV